MCSCVAASLHVLTRQSSVLHFVSTTRSFLKLSRDHAGGDCQDVQVDMLVHENAAHQVCRADGQS